MANFRYFIPPLDSYLTFYSTVQLFLFEIETMGDRNFLACCWLAYHLRQSKLHENMARRRMVAPAQVRSRNLKSQSAWISEISIPFHVEYYDLDETYKEYEEYKYKEYQGKCLKNFSGGGKCPGGICPRGVIVQGVFVQG